MSKIQQQVIQKIRQIEANITESSDQINELMIFLETHQEEIENDKDAYHSLLKTMCANLDVDVSRAIALQQKVSNGIDMIDDLEKYIARGEQSKKDRSPRNDGLE